MRRSIVKLVMSCLLVAATFVLPSATASERRGGGLCGTMCQGLGFCADPVCPLCLSNGVFYTCEPIR